MARKKLSEQWLDAWIWIKDRKDAPAVLFEVARKKGSQVLRKAVPYKPQLPKQASTKAWRDKLRDQCEAACKVIVHGRDLDHDGWGKCVSCTTWARNLQWGHFVPQNESEWLRYDPRNTAMQCVDCNCWKQGRQMEFAMEIDKRAGKAGTAAALIKEASDNRSWRPTIGNLEVKLKELRAQA